MFGNAFSIIFEHHDNVMFQSLLSNEGVRVFDFCDLTCVHACTRNASSNSSCKVKWAFRSSSLTWSFYHHTFHFLYSNRPYSLRFPAAFPSKISSVLCAFPQRPSPVLCVFPQLFPLKSLPFFAHFRQVFPLKWNFEIAALACFRCFFSHRKWRERFVRVHTSFIYNK